MINLTDSLSACTASGILAYAKQIYQQMSGGTATNVEDLLNEHEAEIQSAIKINEDDEVNVTYPENVEREGYILCNLAKDDERIIQDFSDSDFADSVRDGNFYIATNIGNAGITEDEFNGYILDEEITNVNDSNDKSTILNCFKLNDYWVLETESELTASNNLYSCLGYYNKQHMVTPFKLRSDGSLYLVNVGGYDGDESNTDEAQPLQEVLNQIANTSGSSNLPLDEDKNLLVNEDYITVDGGYNLLYAIDYIGYNLSGSSSQYELELYGGYSNKDFHYQLVKFLEDAEILDEDGQTVAIITDATYDSSTKNITITTSVDLGELHGDVFYSRNLNIADCCICLGGFLNKGYYSNLIGRDNYNTGDDAIAIGNYNTNEGEGCVIVGNSNSIQNEHNGYRCYVFGERNKVNDNSILYVLGQYNESTGDDLQSFGLGDGIKFTRGVNAGNDNLNQVGIGVGLDISQNEFVLGQFNKDYDIADNSQKNFFTVGNGNESTKSNSLEQKVNGDLYVLGLGGFNGTNSNVNTTKSLQAKIIELENRIAQLEGGNS